MLQLIHMWSQQWTLWYRSAIHQQHNIIIMWSTMIGNSKNQYSICNMHVYQYWTQGWITRVILDLRRVQLQGREGLLDQWLFAKDFHSDSLPSLFECKHSKKWDIPLTITSGSLFMLGSLGPSPNPTAPLNLETINSTISYSFSFWANSACNQHKCMCTIKMNIRNYAEIFPEYICTCKCSYH